jgi:hypothetical protein
MGVPGEAPRHFVDGGDDEACAAEGEAADPVGFAHGFQHLCQAPPGRADRGDLRGHPEVLVTAKENDQSHNGRCDPHATKTWTERVWVRARREYVVYVVEQCRGCGALLSYEASR